MNKATNLDQQTLYEIQQSQDPNDKLWVMKNIISSSLELLNNLEWPRIKDSPTVEVVHGRINAIEAGLHEMLQTNIDQAMIPGIKNLIRKLRGAKPIINGMLGLYEQKPDDNKSPQYINQWAVEITDARNKLIDHLEALIEQFPQ